METLYDYILENATKFEFKAASLEELLSNAPKLRAHKQVELVKRFFERLNQTQNIDTFIFADEGTYFKIPYTYTKQIENLIKSEFSDVLKYKINGEKIKVFFIDKGEIFETGTGSIGNVSTQHQEQATCAIWNEYVKAAKENNMLDLNDKVRIMNIISDLSSNFNDSWIESFVHQVVCISKYFENMGLNPFEYTLCRYGDTNDVAVAYKNFTTQYARLMHGRRDSFDPVDVIAYQNASAAISSLQDCMSFEDPTQMKDKYLEVAFNKSIFGFSLKKISKNPKYDLYNNGGESKCVYVSGYDVTPSNNNLVVSCTGKFNFDAITDENGEVHGRVKVVELVMRSFGSGRAYIDCTTREDDDEVVPTLGKCPVHIWRPILNCDKTDDLSECMRKFQTFLTNKTDNEVKSALKVIIDGAVKDGSTCLPFILIH